ncbi:MAG: HAMP domain-containing protein [Bdellovibrionales bacterium]|nr:HAMP domain-containing protein [Bdellovibrionales bacterium]
MVSRRTRFYVWWSRAGVGVRLVLFLTVAALLAVLVYLQRPLNEDAYLGSNIAVFALVNFNIALLFVLAFLVGRNVVKLIFDRKRGILGSKLRMRLVAAFVGIALLPTGALVFVSSGLLSKAIEGWFSSPAETSVDGAVEVARIHFQSLEQESLLLAKRIALEIQSRQLEFEVPESLKEYLEKRRSEEKLFGLEMIDATGKPFLQVFNAAAQIEHFKVPPAEMEALKKVEQGQAHVVSQDTESSQFVRAYVPLAYKDQSFVLLATHRVRPELTHAMALITDSFNEYEQLKLFKHPLKSVYILMLYMFTGLILFAAIWFGFYIARELTVPIQRLAEGTHEVARGNYDFQIRTVGDDEVGYLIRSFNTMIRDLKTSREEAQQGRIYIETILGTLAIGVLGLDREHCVTFLNQPLRELFAISDEDKDLTGVKIEELLPSEVYHKIEPLLRISEGNDEGVKEDYEKEISVIIGGKERKILCTVGSLRDSEAGSLGTLWLFDDITALSFAQRMSAWREAARRIAHEIKNPLTPIRLAAQRLQKIDPHRKDISAILQESTSTIVEHVDSINRLAGEFSRFARMPDAEFALADINLLISETVAPFAEENPDCVFQIIADSKLPDITIDREQIRRVLINLLDNAISMISLYGISPGRIVVRTGYDKKRKVARFEVSDNGPGVPDEEKDQIFQPYFTRKDDGTGLGLAIVKSVISDHSGEIRVYNNETGGAKFIVELPLVPQQGTQRQLHRVL